MKNLQDSATPLRVADIVYGTIVDGPGLRTSIYFAGCAHRCPGCHNPSTWDFAGGREVAVGDLLSQVEREGLNVTLSGGDPVSGRGFVAIRGCLVRTWNRHLVLYRFHL